MRVLAACLLVVGVLLPGTANAATGNLLRNDVGLYPRLVKLQHSGDHNGDILASLVTFDGNDGKGTIYESTDDGATFTEVGHVADPESADGKGLCCASIFELPQQVGDMPAGTLLWASDAGQDSGENRRMSIRIWRSDDRGRNWSLLATPDVAANAHGMWEPELSVSADGRLVVTWSDETDQPAHSQTLVQSVSADGVTWSPKEQIVASTNPEHRPGMPIVRKLPDGRYLMTYEICGPGEDCRAHYRTSPDGVTWGDPTDLGPRIVADDGRYFVHTPNYVLGTGGRIYLVGQILANPDGSVNAEGNGRTVMVSDNGPEGPWRTTEAPVSVPGAYDNYCPNYSTALLPVENGLLSIATDYDGDVCKPYYDTKEIA